MASVNARQDWQKSVQHRGAMLLRALSRGLAALESGKISDDDVDPFLRRVAAAEDAFESRKRPRLSTAFKQTLYASDLPRSEDHPKIVEEATPLERDDGACEDSGLATSASYVGQVYVYREAGNKRRTAIAGTAWLAVVGILARRAGVPELAHADVKWEMATDNCAIGKYKRWRAKAALSPG